MKWEKEQIRKLVRYAKSLEGMSVCDFFGVAISTRSRINAESNLTAPVGDVVIQGPHGARLSTWKLEEAHEREPTFFNSFPAVL